MDQHIKALRDLVPNYQTTNSKVNVNTNGREMIDLTEFKMRATQIAQLDELEQKLGKLMAAVVDCKAEMRAVHDNDQASLRKMLGDSSLKNEAAPSAEAPAEPAKKTPSAVPVEKPAKPNGGRTTLKRIFIQKAPVAITNNIKLDAVVISESLQTPKAIFDEIKGSHLYYIPQWNHFAVRINGEVFHGNVGNIYGRSSTGLPTKIKDCRHGPHCATSECTYYHDPVGSRRKTHDIRNYLANGAYYIPPKDRYIARGKYRGLGSREHLDVDATDIEASELQCYKDKLMHDLLGVLAALKYISKKD